MFKVMIVEDEPPIMRALKKTIENNDSDFSVESCCINGKEAIEKLQNNDFDVVITDIKMPVISGLELAKWIHDNKPDVKTVILSGYQDFEYAREALRCKVFDYMLKPLSKERAKAVFDRLKAELAEKQIRSVNHDDLDTVVILMCAGAYLIHGANVLLPGERFWVDEKKEAIMKEILMPDEEYIFFNTNIQSERFLVVGSSKVERQEEIVNELYKRVSDGSLPVTIVYKKGIKFKNAGKTVHELRDHLIKHLILDKGQLICCDGTEDSYEDIGQPYSKADIESIISAIKARNKDSIRTRLSNVILSMRDAGSTQEEINGMLNIVLDSYTLNFPKYMDRKNMSVKRELVTAIAGFVSYDMLIDDITAIFMTLRSDYKEEDRHGKLADSIEEYLIENYNKNITNDIIAKKFGFVPSYISRIFKLRKGVSPSEYITKYRIKTAKKLMLENPEIMIKQVAEMVGFKESYYFSKTFKRETGMWPTEFLSGK